MNVYPARPFLRWQYPPAPSQQGPSNNPCGFIIHRGDFLRIPRQLQEQEGRQQCPATYRYKHGAGRHWGVSVEIIMHLMFMLFIFYTLSAYGYFCGFIGILFGGTRVAL